MNKSVGFIKRNYYPCAVWLITATLSPLLYFFYYLTFLSFDSHTDDSGIIFAMFPLTGIYSLIYSSPAFIVFCIAYYLVRERDLSVIVKKGILLAVNVFNVIASFYPIGRVWNFNFDDGVPILFPLFVWLVSSAFILIFRLPKATHGYFL